MLPWAGGVSEFPLSFPRVAPGVLVAPAGSELAQTLLTAENDNGRDQPDFSCFSK